MKIIVGLGNPGRKYSGTRHNVGFEVLTELAKRYAASSPKHKFQAEVAEARIAGTATVLVCPQTFMNLSGRSVAEVVGFYKLPLEELLVVCDDFQLPLGRLRVRKQGSAGGQKGLADVIRHVGEPAVPRLRIGVGPLPAGWDAADFVLSRFSRREKQEIEPALVRAADAVVRWVEVGIDACMNEFNKYPENQSLENGEP